MQIGVLTAILRLRDAGFSSGLRSATASVGRAGRAIAIGLTAATGVMVALGVASIKAASDFESSFAGVRKTVNATEEEFAALSQGFRDMAKTIPVNVNELNRIGEAAGQLGIKTENILSFTRTMADLGVTTNLSADAAATALARLANITGLSQNDFDRLGSAIVGLGNSLATTEAEIVNFGLKIAASGKLAGLTEAEILGIGAAMSSVGVEAQAGGTAVQKVLIGMTKAAEQGGEDLAVFARAAGMSAQQFADAFEKDAAGAFTAFVEGLGTQGNKAFKTLELLGLEDQRLIRSFLSLAGAGDLLSRSIETGTQAFADNTALAKEAAQRYETFASQMTVLKNNVNEVFISMGELLLPVMRDVVAEISGYLQREGPMIAEAFGVFLVQGIDFAIGALGRLAGALTFIKKKTNELGSFFSGLWLLNLQNQRDRMVELVEQYEAAGESTDKWRARIQELDSQIAQAGGTMTGFNQQWNETIETGESFQGFLDRIQSRLDGYKEKILETAQAMREQAEAARLAAIENAKFFGSLGPGAFAVEGLTGAINDTEKAWGSASSTASQYQTLISGPGGLFFQLELLEDEQRTLAEATRALTTDFGAWFDGIRTGNATIDGFLSRIKSFLGIFKSIGSALSNLGSSFGGFFSQIGGLFGGGGGGGGSFFGDTGAGAFKVIGEKGAAGILGGLSGILSKAASFAPLIGPLIAAFGPLLFDGIKKLFGGIKNLFGGPSGAEVAGRQVAADFRDAIRSELSADVLADVLLQFPGEAENAAFLAALQQSLIAAGVAAEEAGAQARQWGIQLFEAEKQGADAVQVVIDAINAATQAAIDGNNAINDIVNTSTTFLDRRFAVVSDRIKAAGLTAEQEALRLERALARIDARIAARQSGVGAGSGGGGFRHGSGGFVDFGQGTNVTLHGVERVQTVAQASASDGRPIVIENVIVLDGKVLARNQVKHLPKALRNAGVG